MTEESQTGFYYIAIDDGGFPHVARDFSPASVTRLTQTTLTPGWAI